MRKKAEGTANTQLYKPREASANNKNLHRFTEEQLAWVQAELGPLLDFFEYNANETVFFPDVAVSSTDQKFTQLNALVRERTLTA